MVLKVRTKLEDRTIGGTKYAAQKPLLWRVVEGPPLPLSKKIKYVRMLLKGSTNWTLRNLSSNSEKLQTGTE